MAESSEVSDRRSESYKSEDTGTPRDKRILFGAALLLILLLILLGAFVHGGSTHEGPRASTEQTSGGEKSPSFTSSSPTPGITSDAVDSSTRKEKPETSPPFTSSIPHPTPSTTPSKIPVMTTTGHPVVAKTDLLLCAISEKLDRPIFPPDGSCSLLYLMVHATANGLTYSGAEGHTIFQAFLRHSKKAKKTQYGLDFQHNLIADSRKHLKKQVVAGFKNFGVLTLTLWKNWTEENELSTTLLNDLRTFTDNSKVALGVSCEGAASDDPAVRFVLENLISADRGRPADQDEEKLQVTGVLG
ncbi:uncharacterized protein LOC135392889 isoform X2 [Ornithodoros turicata]|uniref:uncharacterized protein LOC135392889 isoform X2 n=1 Tax=Ornithodoros turicata TaxID=34597 RepID=UPI0031398C23